ncbi:uncharacterized protein V6R79_022095 [Siganus canaliculatus]
MSTQKVCLACKRKIGVASKTCQHCGDKQPYKNKLLKQKEKISQEWKEQLIRNSNINKVHDATDLLLHKWELLEQHPVLLLAKKTADGFVAECISPCRMDSEEAEDAFATIKGIYESLLKVTEVTRMEQSPAQTGEDPAPSGSFSPPVPVFNEKNVLVSSEELKAESSQ